MYAKGMTTRDISSHLKDVYGVDASAEMISHIDVYKRQVKMIPFGFIALIVSMFVL